MVALIAVPILVSFLVAIFCGLGYLIGSAVGIPHQLGLPSVLRLGGLVFLAAGFSILVWLFRYRNPVDILVSTYVTIVNVVHRTSPHDRGQRSEPLVVTGPQRYVRHPLYSAVILLIVGWWLFLDYSFLLFAAFILLLWFNFVVAPLEEKELKALFGVEYESYASKTPRFIPSFRRRSGADSDR
jgi:protein-S-isoprenylcysteine O-methyltransferase Ste14